MASEETPLRKRHEAFNADLARNAAGQAETAEQPGIEIVDDKKEDEISNNGQEKEEPGSRDPDPDPHELRQLRMQLRRMC